jgi:flagellar biosynthesis/type III secretory pathway protein FliH
MKISSVLSALVLGAALTFPVIVVASEPNHAPIEKLITEMADKPDQHHAIAHYYKDKIVEAKKDLAEHTKMRKAYEVGYAKNQTAMEGMRKHCDKLISNAESNIKEYEAMTAEHDAGAVKKP